MLHNARLIFLLTLIVGASLRFVGLTRGDSVVGSGFHTFHPDETTVIQASLGRIDPSDPAFTSYGALPVYLLRGTIEVVGTVLGWDMPQRLDEPSGRSVYLTARVLAALFSCGTLVLVWLLGVRYFGLKAAVLGVIFTALAPGAVQQAHFFIADGLFVLLSTASVLLLLRALTKGDLASHVVAGCLIGLTGAVRLNGLLLGLVLLAAHVMTVRRVGEPGSMLRGLLDRRLWIAGATALLTLLVCSRTCSSTRCGW